MSTPMYLRTNKYSVETLIQNIDEINIKTCINTQTLTADFCVKYVLNQEYMSCIEDTYLINIDYVLSKQQHLTREAIVRAYEKIEGYKHGI
jgi:hypothetical protein